MSLLAICVECNILFCSFPLLLQVLHPREAVVGPGDAMVWFPGWEHETRILQGLSISLSLHFETVSSMYVKTFLNLLAKKVSSEFQDTNLTISKKI